MKESPILSSKRLSRVAGNISGALAALLLMIPLSNVFNCSVDLQGEVFAAGAPVPQKTGKKNNATTGARFFDTVSFAFDGLELSAFLERYSETYSFSWFIDRRVDPSIKLSGSAAGVRLIDAVDQMLGNAGLSFCVLNESFLYVGPEGAANDVLLLLDLKHSEMQLGEIPPGVADRLTARIDFQIAPWSEPRDVFQQLSQRSRIKLSGFDKTPFDCWRAASFHSVCVSDLLTVLALGFNVEYRYDSKSGALKPVQLDRDRTATLLWPSALAKNIKSDDYPDCRFDKEGTDVAISGRFQDLLSVSGDIAATRRKQIDPGSDVGEAKNSSVKKTQKNGAGKRPSANQTVQVTGSVENKTLKALFDYLENTANIYCILDESLVSSGVTLETRVSCEFNKAGIAKIGAVIGKEIGARAEIDGNSITFSKR